MSRAIRFVVAALVLGPAPVLVGCGSGKKDEAPNPDLKVPDIPPSGHGTKDGPKDKKGK
ncbi:MAG: hypothetical protein J0I06_06990 [Planctomycetes bacterium]|nr:hypothetical protein [Planctomycetota bacterium]